MGRAYNGETLSVEMPSGRTVCDIGTFTIWCELASVFFATLVVPETAFVSFICIGVYH